MTLTRRDFRRSVGRLLVLGFQGHTVSSELRRFVREFDLGGIILFARNLESPEQVADLTAEFHALAGPPARLIAIDEEGGRVSRLPPPFTRWPPAAALGRLGSEEVAIRWARAVARELRAAGINCDTIPVLDIHSNPRNPVIGDRALSDDPAVVERLGAAIVRTLQLEDLTACAKHFPGHGDTEVDSHLDLPFVEHPPERIREVELRPFRAAIAAGVRTIMVGHLLLPAFDESRPASLSPPIVTGLLREELRYGGTVMADDLEMKAISATRGTGAATVEAIQAGCDLALICSGHPEPQLEAAEALIHAFEHGELREAAVEDAFARLDTLFGCLPPASRRVDPARVRAAIGTDEHQALALDLAQALS